MTSAELVPVTGRAPAVRRRPRAEADVRTRRGERISASAARKLTTAVPQNSRDARATRWRSYSLWCATYAWAEDEPNAVASYLSDLGDRGHPAKPLEAHFATLRALRAIDNAPLSDAEIKACQLIVRHRAAEEADDPLVEPGRPTPSPWTSCAGWSAPPTAPRRAAGRSPHPDPGLVDGRPRLRARPPQPPRRQGHRHHRRRPGRAEDCPAGPDHQDPPVQGRPGRPRPGGPHPRPRR
ncbi:hypothetical protein [Streptomyces aureus]